MNEEEDDESLKAQKDALQFIYVTPRQLIEKEGSETKAVKVNMYTGTKFDLLGSKEDFRVNSQFVNKPPAGSSRISWSNRKRRQNLLISGVF